MYWDATEVDPRMRAGGPFRDELAAAIIAAAAQSERRAVPT